jgi:hypothetical protein
MQSDAIHSRYRRTELGGNRLLPEYCLIPEDTGLIRLVTMMGNYREVLSALNGRGHPLLAELESVCFNRFQVGQYPG